MDDEKLMIRNVVTKISSVFGLTAKDQLRLECGVAPAAE
jgi:hypothetical protein